ncbi:SNF2 family N-terminal domain-containing protein [Gorgonomyces haynaldii]|nr:SNF2 family N-terminal domain-containing protein [Gorgonomyces haynaldii]
MTTLGIDEPMAHGIMGMRPFESIRQLEEQTNHKLFRSIVKYMDKLQVYQNVDELVTECESTTAEIRSLTEKWPITFHKGDQVPDGLVEQPTIINKDYTLKGYQLIGVSWLSLLYRKKLGGILADEMGLGKTAQVICFIAHLLTIGHSGPHMIIVPASTVGNWLREFENWCPVLQVVAYTGSLKERRQIQDETASRQIHVVLTTYNMATGTKEDRTWLRKLKCKSLILDEGHLVKNSDSQRFKKLMKFQCPFRLLLTGTPLQNNLLELLSLLTFIMPDLFVSGSEQLQKLFNMKDEMHLVHIIDRAKRVMQPFVLRRRKDQVLNDLPQKIQKIEYCLMTKRQQELYHQILVESKSKRDDTSNIMMKLRKASNHPLLHRQLYTDEQLETMSRLILKEENYFDKSREHIYEDMLFMSDFELDRLASKNKSLSKHTLDHKYLYDSGKVKRLEEILENLDKVLIFSQFVIMLDILEQFLIHKQISFVRLDGQTPQEERQDRIDQFQTEDVRVFLLSTKAGGFGINLTAANVVVLYDIDFNPHNDAQAEDRAHRVGQKRDVTVIRMIVKDSVEEHIYISAQKKLALDKSVSEEDQEWLQKQIENA